MEIVQASASHVHHGRREAMSPYQSTLLGQRGLRPLLEGSSVWDATENRRDEVGIVNVAKPEESLVVCTEIDIQTGIEGLLVFPVDRRHVVIVQNPRTRRVREEIQKRD